MSSILCIYAAEPKFPATDQHPDAARYVVGPYLVDAIGEPTAAEVDVVLNKDAGAPDRLAASAIDGMDRLQFEHLFELENRMRAQEGLGEITRAQYRTALINRWKQLNP
jgi:hypothetical protein